MAKKKAGLAFISLEGKMYPRGEKPDNCPKPLVAVATYEMVRTPAQVLRHLAKLGDTFMTNEPCWPDCPLKCPAKQHVVDALDAFLGEK